MEPNREIIKLAEKLKELGYDQKTENDTWVAWNGKAYLWAELWQEPRPLKMLTMALVTPIPSISQTLDWLRDKGEKYFPILFEDKPHEEMLKAMIKVLEK